MGIQKHADHPTVNLPMNWLIYMAVSINGGSPSSLDGLFHGKSEAING
jgi:hypothetical protein